MRDTDGKKEEFHGVRARMAILDQARTYAGQAIQSLVRSESRFEKARGWGIWDLLGGGLLTTWVKHSRVDSAQRHLQVASQNLKRLHAELAKLSAGQAIGVHTGRIDKFADVFLGALYDGVAQAKILRSREGVRAALRQTRRLESELDAALRAVERDFDEGKPEGEGER